MLSISSPMKGAGRGNYYLDLAKEDYYANSLEQPGQWYGKGTERLGLRGKVERDKFQNLLAGLSPDGQQKLVQNAQRPDRQSAWDLTFSAPKSVSVMRALAPEEIRKAMDTAQQQAVQTALAYLEEKAGLTRRGKGGAITEKALLAFATFQHGSSRTNDPHLHTHAVLINLAVRQDGTTGSLRSQELFENKLIGGAVYQTELASRLRQNLGLVIEPDKVGFHIRGVPKELCREFSKRRQAIEKAMQERGVEGAVAAKIATLDTRPAKEQITWSELFPHWQRVGEAFGWSAPQAAQLVHAPAQSPQSSHAFRQNIRQTIASIPPKKRTHIRVIKTVTRLATGQGVNAHAMLREIKTGARRNRLIHLEWRPLFRKAPAWSPASQWKAPVIVIGQSNPARRWGKIIWKKNLLLGEVRVQQKRLFPRAPKWSPAHQLQVPALRLTKKSVSYAPSKQHQQNANYMTH